MVDAGLRPKSLTLMAALLLGVAACFEGPLLGSDPRVRFVNAAPVSIDVLRNNTVVAGGITYENSSGCIDINSSSHGLAVRFQNGPTLSVMEGFLSGARPTIVATRHSSGTQTIVQFISLFSTFTPPSGQAGLRVVNASGMGPYDVHVTAANAALGAPQAVAVGTGNQTLFFGIPTGTQQVRVTAAGTQNVAIDAGTPVFSNGDKVTFIIAPPAASGSPARAFFWSRSDC